MSKFTILYIYIVTICLGTTLALSNPEELKEEIPSLQSKLENDAGKSDRNLQTNVVQCSNGSDVFFFNIQIDLTPQGGFNTGGCNTSLQQKIGADLNTLLISYGVGPLGKGDGAKYLARVCPTPIKVTGRRRLNSNVLNFVWKGGGTCRQCLGDNSDGRKRSLLGDPNWFRNTYVPELQNTLRNAITSRVVINHKTCLGNGPRVDVFVTEVPESQVITKC
jgi:hypothetical protein